MRQSKFSHDYSVTYAINRRANSGLHLEEILKTWIFRSTPLLLLLFMFGCATLEAAQRDLNKLLVANTRTIAGLKIEARSCDINEYRTAICTIFVTSINQDRKLYLYSGGYTKIQDNTGKAHPVRLSFGKDAEVRQIESMLIANTPYEITLTVDNLSSQATSVRAIDILNWDLYLNNVITRIKVVLRQPPLKSEMRAPSSALQYSRAESGAANQIIPTPGNSPSTSSGSRVSTKIFRGLRVDVNACEINSSRVATCRLTLTASSDRKLRLLHGGYTKIQDDTGKSYVTRISYGRDTESSQYESSLIANTPYEVTLAADNIASHATKVRAVDIMRWDMTVGSTHSTVKLLIPHPPMVAAVDAMNSAAALVASTPHNGAVSRPSPTSNPSNISVPTPAPSSATSSNDGNYWEVIGYWDYDGIDGQLLGYGLVLKAAPGGNFGRKWQYQLDLVKHTQLPKRSRFLSPVQINRKLKLICVDAPGYPSYAGNIDLPDTQFDGVYQFGSCKGGN